MENTLKRQRIGHKLMTILLIIVVVLYALPLYIAVVNAFKDYDSIVGDPLALPLSPTFDNFIQTWNKINVPQLYWNSFVITGSSLLLLVFASSMTAYVVARMESKWAVVIQIFFMFGLMVPAQMILIPSIKTMQIFGLFHTLLGMIFFNVAVYFSTSFFLYTEFFKTLPKELEESALIDGASRFTVYRKILLPILKPCTSTVVIFSGMWIWNDFLPPLYLLDPERGNTITTGIYRAVGQYATDWNTVFSAAILASLPIVILYLLMRRQIQSGMAAGAVKG